MLLNKPLEGRTYRFPADLTLHWHMVIFERGKCPSGHLLARYRVSTRYRTTVVYYVHNSLGASILSIAWTDRLPTLLSIKF